MKRSFTFMVISVIAICCIISVESYDTPAYDEAELKAALRGAYDLYVSFFDDYTGGYEGDDIEFYPDPNPNSGRPYTYAVRGDECKYWADYMSILERYYSKDAKEIFVRKADAAEKDGYTYFGIVYGQAQHQSYYIDGAVGDERISFDETFAITSISDEKITVSFGLLHAWSDYKIITKTAEFKYEDGIWKLSGGSFFDDFIKSRNDSPFFASNSPATGDGVFALISLAAASAGVAVMMKKRRAM